jgi:transcriptional regulator with XRE-family HTH domain
VPEVRSPTVRRRELGALLRALRNEKGLTVEQVAESLLCSPSKVSRMETGHGVATPRDIRDLCDLYEVTDQTERDRMMTLARQSKQQAWWQSYDLAYATYVGLEAEAVTISAFQSSVVHGLLHTADYARANHESSTPRLDPGQIDLQIEAKLHRQRVLTQASPPSFAVVLDEAALHRMVGGRAVMADQLTKILDMSALPNVTVQVLPFEQGAHPALESNFTILQLPDPTPGVVFVEGLIGSTYLERADDLKKYRDIFDELQSIALNPKDTADLIAKFLRLYRSNLNTALHSRTSLHTPPAWQLRNSGAAYTNSKTGESDVSRRSEN